jgi:hypothetical protein
MKHLSLALCLAAVTLTACLADDPEGLAKATPAATTVKYDFLHRPLPEIPLPNDIATRHDATSPTGRRINASLIAPSGFERSTRALIDEVDGWGVYQAISIPFTGPLDVQSILDGHRDADYAPENDVVLLVNVDRDSAGFGEHIPLDVGNGNHPVVLEQIEGYWKNDPRGFSLSLFFDEADEDTNGNGRLDEGEDTDADGVLDRPNYLPGATPARDDLAGRADALMSFYDSETFTLIARPMEPLRERTTYAVVVTRRLKDADGRPVGSPFDFVNHTSQTADLEALPGHLPKGTTLADVAFAFTFTTQSIQSQWVAVRDGVYGQGPQAHLADTKAEVQALLPLVDTSLPKFSHRQNPYVLYAEDFALPYNLIATQLLGNDADSEATRALLEGLEYVDFVVMGSFDSPQLYDRGGAFPEAWQGFNFQSWPQDLTTTPAAVVPERVYFTLTVPRKEVSARKDGKPAPVSFISHGYTGNRFNTLDIGSHFARFGAAAIGIDCPSHGLGESAEVQAQARTLLAPFGVAPFVDAAFKGRHFDQNRDGIVDSGADFWTAYLFHTRDVVRQCGLDHVQLAKILRSFDGRTRFGFDADGDGDATNDIAGDFDGDGVVDVGGDTPIGMLGASLGGIMSAVVGGIEPAVTTVVPIAGGGGLGDIGIRSIQGGVREAISLRLMGPLFVGTPREDATIALETIVPDLNDDATLALGDGPEGLEAGDVIVARNLANGERGCSVVSSERTFRVAVQSDLGDPVALDFYHPPALVLGDTECAVVAGKSPYATIDRFGVDVRFQGELYHATAPLVAVAEGMGLRRASPEMRRFMGLGQLVLDPADPAVYATSLQKRPIEYPATGEKTGAHALVVTTIGDMNVPASSGVNLARAAGLVEYRRPDPRFGKPANQVLLETYVSEAVNTLGRYFATDGTPVHLDVENFGEGRDLWGDTVPRLPNEQFPSTLRLGFGTKDALGGASAAIFPYGSPTGRHGFDSPGAMRDDWRKACTERCAADPAADAAACACDASEVHDIGFFMFNMMARYLITDGASLEADQCLSRNDCDWVKPVPEKRRGL